MRVLIAESKGESNEAILCPHQTDVPVGQFFTQLLRSLALRAKRKFLNRFNLICPVQSYLQKYPPSRFTQIKSISSAVPSPRGALAIVTDAGRDAVDAAASGTQRESQGEMNLVSDKTACGRQMPACVRQSRVVLAPVAGVKFAEAKS